MLHLLQAISRVLANYTSIFVIGVAVLECKSGSLTMSSGLFLLLILYTISHKRT